VTQERQTSRPLRTRMLLLCGAALAVGVAASGIESRQHAEAKLAQATDAEAIPTVAVAIAAAGPAEEEIVLPGTVQAEYDTPIYARTSGYLKRWYTDIGTPVKTGDLLAEIDSPEVDQQLQQARAQLVQLQAALVQAQANMELARVTDRRQSQLTSEGWTSQQGGDQARLRYAASIAAVAVARGNVEAQQANVARLEQLVGFERVIAPYDGIVTARETDVGDLINAGSGNGPELFHVADTRKLRIYVQVPQTYAPRIKPGVAVDLRFPEYPGRAFAARLVRSANALDPTARTLLVELEADNAKGEIFPGAYTDVHFRLPASTRVARVAANTLLFRAEGPRIATVGPDRRVVLHEITLGRDFGTTIEVPTGLAPGEEVILNPPASLETGMLVRTRKDDKVPLHGATS
jgi:RND family efflux transporter MFP subunit